MKKYEILNYTELFQGIKESDFEPLLGCLGTKAASFSKGETVFPAGEPLDMFGIVLSGQVQVVQDDYFGNRSILGMFGPGSLIGESFACAETRELPVSAIAAADSELLLIDCRRLSSPCANACGFHARLIRNMMHIIAGKNIALTQKLGIASRRTTREKLLGYLSAEANKAGSGSFTIPFSRQELADYLAVDRSAMSAELGKMRDEGILKFHKNEFELS